MAAKTYQPAEVEEKWYRYWLEQRFFEARPRPDKPPYTVVIPPPNVTGVLHMGHMLNNTIQDVLVRRARMRGFEACWVPGTDHASIATETKVVAMLRAQGISKQELTRAAFLDHAYAWKEKYGGIILDQLQKLGASCDWSRTRFTMEPALSEAVLRVFVDLHRKGLVYRGVRMVNWDPGGQTALSDEEVLPKEVTARMYHLTYACVGSEGHLTVATSRPETIMADVAVAVNPHDPRYTHLHGTRVRIPLLGREIPVITDDYVTTDFGTGVLKVTPAHDLNDYEIGQRHQLPVIDILNDDGTLNAQAVLYVGQDRFEARRNVVKDLEQAGHLARVEEYAGVVQTSERTGAVVEPRLSTQWFVKMASLAGPALAAVENDAVRLHPAKFKNTYRVWMENVRDWCMSRQLWWGQQIPAWYLPDGTCEVALTAREALEQARVRTGNGALTAADLRQDEDVLDTWFSSWLWPISVFDGFADPDNADVRYFYPTSDLVTGPDILFFWVARMVMAGLEFRGEVPFRNVYLTGIVRDAQRRKMSKSLGNSPDPLELIARHGADAVRSGMLFSAPAGNDLLYDERLVEQGRNFCNKLWNAFRLIQSWHPDDNAPTSAAPVRWFGARLAAAQGQIEDHFDAYRVSDALLAVYQLVWDDFCSSYLEMIKPPYGAPIDAATHAATLGYFETLLRLLHPFMPFITEELWHGVRPRAAGASICVAEWPRADAPPDATVLADGEVILEVLKQVRTLRSNPGVATREALSLRVRTDQPDRYQAWAEVLCRLLNLLEVRPTDGAVPDALTFVVKSDTFFVPVSGAVDVDAERARLTQERDYQQGFRRGVAAKLANERFVQNARPEVVDRERQKLADADAKLASIEAGLRRLDGGA